MQKLQKEINNNNTNMSALLDGYRYWEIPTTKDLSTLFDIMNRMKDNNIIDNNNYLPEKNATGKFLVCDENDNQKFYLAWQDKNNNIHKTLIDTNNAEINNSYFNIFFIKRDKENKDSDNIYIDNNDIYKNSVQLAFDKNNDEYLEELQKVVYDSKTGIKVPLNISNQIIKMKHLDLLLKEVNLNSQLEYVNQKKEEVLNDIEKMSDTKKDLIEKFNNIYIDKKMQDEIDKKTSNIFKNLYDKSPEFKKFLENLETNYNLAIEGLNKSNEIKKKNIKISAVSNIVKNTGETLLTPHSDPLYACTSIIRMLIGYGMTMVEIKKSLSEANNYFMLEKENKQKKYEQEKNNLIDKLMGDSIYKDKKITIGEDIDTKNIKNENINMMNNFYKANNNNNNGNNNLFNPMDMKNEMYLAPSPTNNITDIIDNTSEDLPDTINDISNPGYMLRKEEEIKMNKKR